MSGNERVPLHQINENEELGPVKIAEEKPRRSNSSGKSRDSSLIRAIRSGSSSTSLFLQKTNFNDLDIKEIDIFQRNAFHYAVSKPDILRKLLKQSETKAAVQEALNQADNEGETPIHRAAITPSIESLEILFEYDKSLMKLKTSTGKRSVLHMAVRNKSVVAVKFVLDKIPELANCVDSMSQTPVHYAASQKQTSILQLLISKGCATTEMDANDQLPIHIAASKGLRNTVELLLREDPDIVDAVDNADQSPLLLASKHGFSNVASFLLLKNADYKLKDNVGLTAFDWAVRRSLPDVVQVFLERNEWREIVNNTSSNDPEGCLAAMITNMPEMAKMLLDKCITTKGTKDHPASYQVIYDFFFF